MIENGIIPNLHMNVQCSIIHNRQKVKPTEAPISKWVDKQDAIW